MAVNVFGSKVIYTDSTENFSVLILLGDRFLSSIFFNCFWILVHGSSTLLACSYWMLPMPYLFVLTGSDNLYLACVTDIYENLLESTWWRQTKTILENNNSSNEMKAQTNKCHNFSVLLFNQLSLYMQCLCELR